MSIERRKKQQAASSETSPEKAAEIIKADADRRVKACAEEFKSLLEKHKCSAVIEFAGRGNQAQSQLIFVAQ